MDKEDVIEILKIALNWYRGDDTIYAFEAQQAFNYFEDVIDYIKSEINLSEILKWEQDVEYMDPETAKIYKISDNNLYKKVHGKWIQCYDILFTDNNIDKVQKFSNIQVPRYYWKIPLINNGYFNYCQKEDICICGGKRPTIDYQTIFTEAEIKEIERKHNVDLSFLQKKTY